MIANNINGVLDFTLADVLRKKGVTGKVAVDCDPNLDFLK